MSRSEASIFAMLDPAHLLDGLFTPTAYKDQTLFQVEADYDDKHIRFEGPQLSATHQSVLLAIVARAARQPGKGESIIASHSDGKHAKLLDLLNPTGVACNQPITILKCAPYALLSDAGMGTGGKDYKLLLRLLTKISSVTMHRVEGRRAISSRLISFQADSDQLIIALNWRLSSSINGEQNSPVSLKERRALGKDPVAKILHAWFCGYTRLGKRMGFENGVKIDTLIRHVWGKRPFSEAVSKKRRVAIKRAVNKINELPGWEAHLVESIVHVIRAKHLRSPSYSCLSEPSLALNFE